MTTNAHRVHVHPSSLPSHKHLFPKCWTKTITVLCHLLSLPSSITSAPCLATICYCCTPHSHTHIQWLFKPFILSSLSNELVLFSSRRFPFGVVFFFLLNLPFAKRECANDCMTELLSDFNSNFFPYIFSCRFKIPREHNRVSCIFTNYSAIICINENDWEKKTPKMKCYRFFAILLSSSNQSCKIKSLSHTQNTQHIHI